MTKENRSIRKKSYDGKKESHAKDPAPGIRNKVDDKSYKLLLSKGHKRGYVTYAEIHKVFPK
ncbi:MAG: RNA polymerase sigma factor region1.1 domain-containing protein, partial [Thermodesulfobacteriota bacterium]